MAVLLLAGFRFAGGLGGCHGRGHTPERVQQLVTWKVDDALDALQATEAQRQQVHQEKDALLQQGRALMEAHRGSREELLHQWEAPSPDSARLHALVDARMDALRAFAHRAMDAALRVHALLTPEQRARVAGHLRERMGER